MMIGVSTTVGLTLRKPDSRSSVIRFIRDAVRDKMGKFPVIYAKPNVEGRLLQNLPGALAIPSATAIALNMQVQFISTYLELDDAFSSVYNM